jgi:hypothetical protein
LIGTANNTIQAFTELNLACQTSTANGALCSIDDLRIYNTALPAYLVESIYSSGGNPAPNLLMPQAKLAWSFEGTTTDYVTGLTGTTTGAVSYSTGKYNQAVNIANSPVGTPHTGNNFVSYNNPLTLSATVGTSMSMWVNISQLPAVSEKSIVFAINGSSGGQIWIEFYTIGPQAVIYNSTNYFVVFHSSAPSISTWYHYTVVCNSTTLSFYVNGVLVGTTAITGPPSFAGGSINIGGNGNYAPFNGLVDDLRIFDRALTSTQVQSIYNQQGYPVQATTNLVVGGDTWFSNSLTATNVVAISFASPTLNAGTMSSTATVVPSRSTVTTLNATTLNVLSIYGQVGVGVGVSGGGASLAVQGNVYTSNALTSVNVSLAGTTYYNEDLTARSIHLLPSAANAVAIQSWISATCNAADQPSQSYWSTSRTPSYGNVVSGPPGGAAYSGGVLLPDGRVLFVPANTSNIGIYNPKESTFTSISGKGVTPGNFKGGVLMPNGNVLFCPQVSNIGQFNPLSSTFSNTLTLPGGEYNGVLTSNGVTFTPTGVPSNVINYNYLAGTSANVLTVPAPPVTPVLNWSGATSGSAVARRAIAWSPQLGLFVAGGDAVPYQVYSADGKNWTAATTTAGTGMQGATWSPQLGLFVMVGGTGPTYLSYSADGKNWTAATTIVGTSWRSVVWSPQLGLFVAAGANSPWIAYSADGKNWTAAASAGGATNNQGVAWSPQLGLFVAGGTAGTYLTYSTNGTTWTAATTSVGTGWRSIAWSPQLGIFVAAGTATPWLAYSTDGKNWVAATTVVGNSWQGVAWSPQLGLFIAVGTTTPYIAYSANGRTWVTATVVVANWFNAAWSPELGLFVVAGTTTPWLAYTANVSPVQTGSLLLPSGNVVFSQQGSSNITQFNPVTRAQSNISIGRDGYAGLVLAPNGNVVAVPNASNVLVINPTARTSSNIGPVTAYANTSSFFQGGVLLPSGNVIFVPGTSSNVGMFDPVALTYSNSTPTRTSNVAFSGGTLIPNGQVVFTPAGSTNVSTLYTMTPASTEMCLSPYFNKGP